MNEQDKAAFEAALKEHHWWDHVGAEEVWAKALEHRDAQAQQDKKDAERYRWLRERLQIRWLETVTGDKKRGMDIRIGHSFFNPKSPKESYLDEQVFESCCKELDDSIDAAIAAAKGKA